MSEEELIETLRTFENKRVEQLEEPAKNVFYAIMKIADERDKYKEIIKEVREYIEKSYKEDYGNNENYIPIEHLNLKNCSYERSLVVLDIVNKAIGVDKE